MALQEDLRQKIGAYHGDSVGDPHHRYRSWEHCYRFFQSRTRRDLLADKNTAALHLGFYLASWGMYRGSAFLLQRTYTVHEGVIERLGSPEFEALWQTEVGADPADVRLVPMLVAAVAAVKDAYAPFGPATDTLATKVLLGTIGCLPACDRYFIDGFKASGRPYYHLNQKFVERILAFCFDHRDGLRAEQERINRAESVRYPLMKLADMYFWEVGREASEELA